MQRFADTVIMNKRRDADSGAKMGPDLLSRFLDPKTGDNKEPPSIKVSAREGWVQRIYVVHS